MKYHYLLVFLFSLFWPYSVVAHILYTNNFDDKPDWSSEPEGTGGLASTHDQAKKIGFSEIHIGADKITGEGHEYFEISSKYGIGEKGKGLAVRVESEKVKAWRGGRLCLHFADKDNFPHPSIDPTGYDELWISYWIKWSTPWDWGQSGNYIKMLRLYPNVDYKAVWNSTLYGGLSDHYHPNGDYKEAHVIIDWGSYDPPYYLPTYCSEDDGSVPHCITKNARDNSLVWSNHFADGKWHHVEHHVKMNDIGMNNAFTEIYIDGNLMGHSSHDFYLRKSDIKFNDIILFDNHYIACSSEKCPNEQEYYIDNLVISTNRYGFIRKITVD